MVFNYVFIGVLGGMTSMVIKPYMFACGASGPLMGFIAAHLVYVLIMDDGSILRYYDPAVSFNPLAEPNFSPRF